MRRGLALDEAVGGPVPDLDFIMLVIEEIVALAGSDCQNRVAGTFFISHHCDQQGILRPAIFCEDAALEENEILTITLRGRVIPEFDDAMMILIRDRADGLVDGAVDFNQLVPACFGEIDAFAAMAIIFAIDGVALAKTHMADGWF